MNQNSARDHWPGMEVWLGLWLGGQHGTTFAAQLDSLTTGPLGMLNVLETQLGLLRLDISNSDRVLQYLEVLNRLDSPTRFYHQSFAVDGLGTAAMLARTPGIGSGPAWEEALERIEKACEDSEYDWNAVRERIRVWIEHPRFDPASGITLVALTDRLKQLASYFQGRLLDKDAATQMAFTSALSQILTLQRSVNALALQGETHIGVQSLQRTISSMLQGLTKWNLCCGLVRFQTPFQQYMKNLVWIAAHSLRLAILLARAFPMQKMHCGRRAYCKLCGCAVCFGSMVSGSTQAINGLASPAH